MKENLLNTVEEIDSLIRKRIGRPYVFKPVFNKDGEKEGYTAAYTSHIAEDIYNAGYRKIEQGKWIITERGCVITCSNCKERVELYYPDGTQTGPLPYCPYCGSKNKEV